jgi:2,5-diamino-6-(ribosylamino)-4(3H)-pyrimidinone 5'-phosphate reductase
MKAAARKITARPRVVIHSAVSLDGRFDWLTPDMGQFYGLVGRWKEDATLAGSETMRKAPMEEAGDDEEDELEETAPDDSRPLLAVVDSRGRVRTWPALRKAGYWRGMVALCSRKTPAKYLENLRRWRVESIVAGKERVDLPAALRELRARYRVKVVRVDAGGALNGVLLRAGLADEVSVLVHPCLIGGTTPQTFFRAKDLTGADGVIQLRLAQVKRLDGDVVWLRYEVARTPNRRQR